ncbi:MAG: serine/threonine-protein kinase [Pirellula sp.]
MTQITSDRILELIEKSKLVEPSVLQSHLERIRAENDGNLPDDPVAICKALEDAGLVTRWQCEKFLQGKYKGFFLGNHKLLGHLASGGMSSVYLAEHLVMKHKRAIKVLPKSKLGNNSYLQRFQLEAKAIASLNHPNIVRAFDINHEKDTHYLVMEYVEGADMQNLVRKHGPLPFAIVADYIAQAARGLQHAHDVGLIHRDVKPANLLVNKEGVVKVLDLGLALFSEDTDASLTMEYNDKVLGTADYLPPEQAINSHKIDSRADMYGLGCTMYFLLTGHPPFPEGSIPSRIIKHQNAMPPDIRLDRPDCPGELDGICVKMMQKDPKYRYTSCKQVADVLETWLAKYREETKDNPAKKRENNLSVSDIMDGKTKSQANVDTVTNRGGGTIGGKVTLGSAIVKLSTSDSGVLQAIARGDGSTVDSKIDLVHDTSAPNPKKSKSQAIAKAGSSLSSSGKPSQPQTPLVKPLVKPLDRTKSSAPTAKPIGAKGKTEPKSNKNTNTLILAGAAVVVVVLFVGILIAILATR